MSFDVRQVFEENFSGKFLEEVNALPESSLYPLLTGIADILDPSTDDHNYCRSLELFHDRSQAHRRFRELQKTMPKAVIVPVNATPEVFVVYAVDP